MARHEFGGDWTSDKLERLRKYLAAYTTIFHRNPRARYLTTIYVDAFAGTGDRIETGQRPNARDPILVERDEDRESFKKGSARIALEIQPSFDRFIFIESHGRRFKDLEKLRKDFPEKADNIEVKRAEANAFLTQWCQDTDWRKHRAVVFLDPYGMQVAWATLEALAKTEAVDLWLLVPHGTGFNRLLRKARLPDDGWAKALTRALGTEDWMKVFYPKRAEVTLFGVEESQRKQATLDAIGGFFLDRLNTIFAKVAPNPLRLYNSRNSAIYLLCFAAGNPKTAATAVKIASDILKR